MARSTAFYEKLGWSKAEASQDAITFIQLKGTTLALFARQSLAEDAHVENSVPGFSGIALAHNVTSERGVDAVYKFALSCGATPVKEPEKVFWGGYSGYFADPGRPSLGSRLQSLRQDGRRGTSDPGRLDEHRTAERIAGVAICGNAMAHAAALSVGGGNAHRLRHLAIAAIGDGADIAIVSVRPGLVREGC